MPAIANDICKRKSEELDAAVKVNIRMDFLFFFFGFVFLFLLVLQLCRILQQLCSNNSGVGLLKKYLFHSKGLLRCLRLHYKADTRISSVIMSYVLRVC